MRVSQQLVRIADLDRGRFAPAKGESATKFRRRIFAWNHFLVERKARAKVLSLIAAGERGAEIPPLFVVREQDGQLGLADGFHRCCAASVRGQTTIRAVVIEVESAKQEGVVMGLVVELSENGVVWTDLAQVVEGMAA